MNYYNDNDAFCCEWLKNLIASKLLPKGDVDARSIKEVKAKDLKGYTQCHFFAGIGGWPYALQLASWLAKEPVWTGSCPCQPFSVAGRQKAEKDSRDLWPDFLRLISACNVPTVFGEQVAGRLGRQWLVRVRRNLEALEYVVGDADLCAAGVGAPHIRQRLYWVAQSQHAIRRQVYQYRQDGRNGQDCGRQEAHGKFGTCGEVCGLAYPKKQAVERTSVKRICRENAWSNFEALYCLDGKTRRTEPSIFPLAYGVSNRVGRLRAYGNAIVPPLAAKFIRAFMEVRHT